MTSLLTTHLYFLYSLFAFKLVGFFHVKRIIPGWRTERLTDFLFLRLTPFLTDTRRALTHSHPHLIPSHSLFPIPPSFPLEHRLYLHLSAFPFLPITVPFLSQSLFPFAIPVLVSVILLAGGRKHNQPAFISLSFIFWPPLSLPLSANHGSIPIPPPPLLFHSCPGFCVFLSAR